MIDFTSNAFEIALQRIENDPSVCELQEYNLIRLSEIDELSQSVDQKIRLSNDNYNREIELLNTIYDRKVQSFWTSNNTKHAAEWTYYKNLENSKAKFDIEFNKYENELERLKQERCIIKCIMYECERRKMQA
ncbi:hypothetical protein [Wolbachia endosymbiont (group A) of Tiphia femorata]|uniref:hypothetical protein n=2 Tax=unclassified Wolbachia TaxID=2640676 RepID=UPI0022303D48|nr:hypothetical protein [Wolbachia endosymbiont (group A) of Tiphia femorata]